ncbi:MAG: RNA methyltransferase [Desulfobacterales bacterium]|nr:RNA methyltransferase [Desulfobacterales bacterium]
MALLHYPVKSKDGSTIASAITSIDLHDIARAARTYGVSGFYVVTPLTDQQAFARKIIGHWTDGAGAVYNPDRGRALALIHIRESLHQVTTEITRQEELPVRVVATSAADSPDQTGYPELSRALAKQDAAWVLALGTAWGLTAEFMDAADFRLAPISTGSGYNHLSVRSAAAIMLDRLLGR